jgi:hypothetical protein
VQLGGPRHRSRGWGRALACRVSGEMVGWRSALGNALAQRGQELGLAPAGVVAYIEVGLGGATLGAGLPPRARRGGGPGGTGERWEGPPRPPPSKPAPCW